LSAAISCFSKKALNEDEMRADLFDIPALVEGFPEVRRRGYSEPRLFSPEAKEDGYGRLAGRRS
jgi:hypothetical protein